MSRGSHTHQVAMLKQVTGALETTNYTVSQKRAVIPNGTFTQQPLSPEDYQKKLDDEEDLIVQKRSFVVRHDELCA